MKPNVIVTHIKRELWEHRVGFVLVPLGIAFLCVLLLAVLVIQFNASLGDGGLQFGSGGMFGFQINDMPNTQSFQELLKSASQIEADVFGKIVIGITVFVNILLCVDFFIVLLSFSHSCLFDDRKNRDILFWRSMPVSETTNVLVKLGFIVFYVPLVMLAINSALVLLGIIAGAIFFIGNGIAVGDLLASLLHSHDVFIALKIAAISVFGLILLLPIIGFILFCSAIAKKSPFLTSSVVPAVLLVLDKIAQEMFAIDLHIINSLTAYGILIHDTMTVFASSIGIAGEEVILTGGGGVMVALLWVIAIGGAFAAAAIWLRNNRFEI